jgi:hypothetical protein
MALNFPPNPEIGDVYSDGLTLWTWNGEAWVSISTGSGGGSGTVGPQGPPGPPGQEGPEGPPGPVDTDEQYYFS